MADDVAPQTIKVRCNYRVRPDTYEADVAPDLRREELVAGLVQAGYLEAAHPGEIYHVTVRRTDRDLAPNEPLDRAGVEDGDELEIVGLTHGAGPEVVDIAAVLAAAKVAVDAAQVVVDAYRAKTERMAAELRRAELETARRERESTERGRGGDET
jgi:hypothetical protein